MILVLENVCQSASSWGTMGCGVQNRGWSAFSSDGCVAEQSTTVAPQTFTKKLTAKLKSVSMFVGTVCTSSITITLLQRDRNRRMALVLPENSVSRNCTSVVTVMGASQFSISSSRSDRSSEQPASLTMLEWCSNISEESPMAR